MLNIFPQNKFRFAIDGRNVTVEKVYGSGKRKSPPRLVVTVDGTFAGKLRIRYENVWDRFCKWIGLNKEPEIPDRQVNDQLYFEGDDQQFVNRIFLNSELKRRVLEILAQKFIITIQPQKCTFTQYSYDDPFDETVAQGFANVFGDFAAGLPKSGEIEQNSRFEITKGLLWTLGFGVAALGFILLIMSFQYCVVESGECWAYAKQYIAPLLISAAVVSFFLVRGFATSSNVYLVFMLCFNLGVVMAAYGGTQYVNGKYDETIEATDHIATVINKYTTRHKNSTSYHVVLPGWGNHRSSYSFTVSYATYASIIPGVTKYDVRTKPGKLGIEWTTDTVRYTGAE